MSFSHRAVHRAVSMANARIQTHRSPNETVALQIPSGNAQDSFTPVDSDGGNTTPHRRLANWQFANVRQNKRECAMEL